MGELSEMTLETRQLLDTSARSERRNSLSTRSSSLAIGSPLFEFGQAARRDVFSPRRVQRANLLQLFRSL